MATPKSYMEYRLLMNAASYYDPVEGIVLPAVVSLSGVSMHTWPLRGIRIFPTMLPYWDEEGTQIGGYTAGACGIGHMHLRDVVHRAKILSSFAGIDVSLYDGIDTAIQVTNVTGQHHQYKDAYEWSDDYGFTGNVVYSQGWEPYFKDDFVFARGNDIDRWDGCLFMAPFWPDYKDQTVYIDFYDWDDGYWPLIKYSENPDLGSTAMMSATLITFYDAEEFSPILPTPEDSFDPYQFWGWHNDFMLDNYADGRPAIYGGGDGSGAFPEENSMGIIRAPISNETHHGWTISSIMPQGSSWGDICPDFVEGWHLSGIESEGTKLWRSAAGRTAILLGTDRVWIDCQTTEDGADHCYHRGNQMSTKENDFGLVGLPPNMPPDAAFYHIKSFTDGVINIEGSPYGDKQLLHTNLIFFGEFTSDRTWYTVVDNDVDPDTGDAWIDVGVDPTAYGIPMNCTFCLTTTSKAVQIVALAESANDYRQQAWGASVEEYAFCDEIKQLINAVGWTSLDEAFHDGVLDRLPAMRTSMINDLQLAWQPITVGITPHISHMRPEYNHEVYDPETSTYRNTDVASWVIYKNPKFVSGASEPYEILEHYILEPGGQISLGKTGVDSFYAVPTSGHTYIGDIPQGAFSTKGDYFISHPTTVAGTKVFRYIDDQYEQLSLQTRSLGHPGNNEVMWHGAKRFSFSIYYYNQTFTIKYTVVDPGEHFGEVRTETHTATSIDSIPYFCYVDTDYNAQTGTITVKNGTTTFTQISYYSEYTTSPKPEDNCFSIITNKGFTFSFFDSDPYDLGFERGIWIIEPQTTDYEYGHAARRLIIPVVNPRAMGISYLSAPVVAIPDLRAHWNPGGGDIDFGTAFDRDVEVYYFATSLTIGEMTPTEIWNTSLTLIGSFPCANIKNFETHRLEIDGQLPLDINDINDTIYVVVKFKDDDTPVDNSVKQPIISEANDTDTSKMSYSDSIRMYSYNNNTESLTADRFRAYGYLTAFVTCGEGVDTPGAIEEGFYYDTDPCMFLDPRPV